jgi:hypothetical protein
VRVGGFPERGRILIEERDLAHINSNEQSFFYKQKWRPWETGFPCQLGARFNTEKLQIVQLMMEPGASVAEVAREYGVNAIQVFKWRRTSDPGELIEARVASAASLPATLKFVES